MTALLDLHRNAFVLSVLVLLAACAAPKMPPATPAAPAAPVAATVAVVDSGIDATHPWLSGRVDFPLGHREFLYVTDGLKHGTAVASVIARLAPGLRVASVPWDFGAYGEWRAARDACMRGQSSACALAWQHVAGHLFEHAAIWSGFPVVNFSHGLDHTIGDRLDARRLKVTLELLHHVRATNPQVWNAYVQAHVPAHLRSVSVRALGNRRDNVGDGASDLHRTVTYLYPELWGHSLFVTALDPATGELADFANVCGTLPPRWEPRVFGPHFCVAAPGTHRVAVLGGTSVEQSGTSYASAYVSALLAELHLRCGGIRGAALVGKLLEAADRTPPYDDVYRYGAGVVTLARVRAVCPA